MTIKVAPKKKKNRLESGRAAFGWHLKVFTFRARIKRFYFWRNAMDICDAVKYVGVDDHEIDLFEGQFEVPGGMAYNSL